MKIEKSNNPAAVGALVLVLVLIVGRILWMIFGHSGSVAAASAVSAGSPTPTAAPAPVTKAKPAAAAASGPEAVGASPVGASPVGASSVVTPNTTRNPFSVALRPAQAAPNADGLPHRNTVHHGAFGAETMPLTSLPPFAVRVVEPEPGAVAKRPSAPHVPAALPPDQSAAKAQAESLPTLKLTATVGGTEPLAVVQTTNPEPVILHVGDPLDGMRVAAIHEQEVVFERGNGFWILRLQSAADSAAAGSISVATTPATSQPVISLSAPEEKNDGREEK